MGVIAWIILGLGWSPKCWSPAGNPKGLVITTLIGIPGALLAGFLATRLFHVDGTQGFFDLSTWITAIAGAAVLLLAFHLVTGQSSSRRFGRSGNDQPGRPGAPSQGGGLVMVFDQSMALGVPR